MQVKINDTIVWYTTMRHLKTKEGTVARLGTGPDTGLIFVRATNGLEFAITANDIAAVNGAEPCSND